MKKLAGLANNLSAMIVSESASELYEELMDLPDGTVKIDLLSCSGYLNDSTVLKTPYIRELRDWLLRKIDENHIKPEDISKAIISLDIDSSTVPCDRKNTVHYLATATTVIDARDRHFEQRAPVTHVWHKRPANPRLDHDRA
jgi:hypothetical protein